MAKKATEAWFLSPTVVTQPSHNTLDSWLAVDIDRIYWQVSNHKHKIKVTGPESFIPIYVCGIWPAKDTLLVWD